MKVSVVVPAYNEERYIRACLEALLRQTDPPDEIIVVDNNSTDKTAEIAGQFPVRIVRETKQGIAWARNCGFNAAQFDIIARCDADSMPPPDWIAKIKKNFIDKHHIDGLTGPCSFYDSSYDKAIRMLRGASIYLKITELMLGHPPFCGFNMAIRKTAWEKIRDVACTDDSKVHEDIDLAIHLAHAGGTIALDKTMIMPTSARRMRYPLGSLVKYVAKWPGTKLQHKKSLR